MGERSFPRVGCYGSRSLYNVKHPFTIGGNVNRPAVKVNYTSPGLSLHCPLESPGKDAEIFERYSIAPSCALRLPWNHDPDRPKSLKIERGFIRVRRTF